MSSADILSKMNKIRKKKSKMEEHVRTLKSKTISAQHVYDSRDLERMAGDKYDAQHNETKQIISDCVKSIKKAKSEVVNALNTKIAEYQIELELLQVSYGLAVAAEVAKALEDAAKKAAKSAADKLF